MKKHKFKPKEVKRDGLIPTAELICFVCKEGPWETNHLQETIKYFTNVTKRIQKQSEDYPIKKLQSNRTVQLSSTLAGQRELIREIKNKLNEVINFINNKENQ